MPNFRKWLKNYVCTSNCKGICFFVGRGRMFIHFLRSKDIALIARRSLVHLKKMEFRKKQHSGKKHNIKGEHSMCTQRARVFSARLRGDARLLSHFLVTLFSVPYKLNKESSKAKQTARYPWNISSEIPQHRFLFICSQLITDFSASWSPLTHMTGPYGAQGLTSTHTYLRVLCFGTAVLSVPVWFNDLAISQTLSTYKLYLHVK